MIFKLRTIRPERMWISAVSFDLVLYYESILENIGFVEDTCLIINDFHVLVIFFVENFYTHLKNLFLFLFWEGTKFLFKKIEYFSLVFFLKHIYTTLC